MAKHSIEDRLYDLEGEEDQSQSLEWEMVRITQRSRQGELRRDQTKPTNPIVSQITDKGRKKKNLPRIRKEKDHLTDFATLAEIWKEVSNSFSLTVFDFVTFAQKLIFFSLIPKSFQLGYFCL